MLRNVVGRTPSGRFSKKRYLLNLESWIKQINEEHVGHKLQYFSNGTNNNYGEILRANEYEFDDHKTFVIRIKKEGSVFPEKVFSDQIISCSCVNGGEDVL